MLDVLTVRFILLSKPVDPQLDYCIAIIIPQNYEFLLECNTPATFLIKYLALQSNKINESVYL